MPNGPLWVCEKCGRRAPPARSLEILEWGEGGTMAHFVDDDPLMVSSAGLICPDCAAEQKDDEANDS